MDRVIFETIIRGIAAGIRCRILRHPGDFEVDQLPPLTMVTTHADGTTTHRHGKGAYWQLAERSADVWWPREGPI